MLKKRPRIAYAVIAAAHLLACFGAKPIVVSALLALAYIILAVAGN
jgi:hypothetical protein